MTDDEMKTLRVTTEATQGTGGVEAFREIFGREILGIEIDPLDGHPLDIHLTLRSLPGFAMASGSLSPVHSRHTPTLVDNDDLVLVVLQSGLCEVNQYGRVATVNEGEAVLTANGAAATITGPAPTRVINFRLSRNLLTRRIADLDALVARPIPKNDRLLKLLVGYAAVLNDQSELGTSELRRMWPCTCTTSRRCCWAARTARRRTHRACAPRGCGRSRTIFSRTSGSPAW